MNLLKDRLGRDIYGLIIKYNDNSYKNLINKLEKKYLKSHTLVLPSVIDLMTMAVKKGYAGIIFMEKSYIIYNHLLDEIKSKKINWIKKYEHITCKYLSLSDDKKYKYIDMGELDLFENVYN